MIEILTDVVYGVIEAKRLVVAITHGSVADDNGRLVFESVR